MRSWFDIHTEEVWPAYRTSHSNYNPFKNIKKKSNQVSFVIGDEECDKRKLDEPVIIDFLKKAQPSLGTMQEIFF